MTVATRLIRATLLNVGDVLALPFGKTATVTNVKVGRKFVNLKLAEYPATRVGLYEEVLIQLNEKG